MKVNASYLTIGLAFLPLPIILKSIVYLPLSIVFFILAFIATEDEDEEENNKKT